jgi:hypothetical protein
MDTKRKFEAICHMKQSGEHDQATEVLNSLTSTERKEFYKFLPTYHFYEEQETKTQIVEDICYFSTITKNQNGN